jgi:hypothetical protein
VLLVSRLALVAVTVLVYRRALDAYFFDDDFQWLAGTLSFAPSNLVAIGSLTHFYRPMLDVYFAAATPLFGGSPVMFHTAHVALHAANGLVLFALLRRISASTLYAFAGALFFLVQPADVDAVAWVGAIGEPLSVLFGSLSLLWFLEWRTTGAVGARRLSIGAFLCALLTHESSVVFLPVLALAQWAFVPREARGLGGIRAAPGDLRRLTPYLLLTIAYVAIDLSINTRNYVVAEGYYGFGWHILQNALEYITALYVGRRDFVNYAIVIVGIAAVLLKGNRRVVFAMLWMLLALTPFIPFNWGTASRYLYGAAIGFSMLAAEAVTGVDRRLAIHVHGWRRGVAVGVLMAAVAVRFVAFATANVDDFTRRTDVYRQYAATVKAVHGRVPSHTLLAPDPALGTSVPHRFANALVQWEYRDPTIELTPYEP